MVAITGGGAAAAIPALVSSLKVAVVSSAIGAGTSAAGHLVSTGSFEGIGEATLNGAADGFMWGGITAGATTVAMASKGMHINKIGRLKTTKNTGKGYNGIRVGIKKGQGFSYKSYEIHSPHVGTKHNVWHYQINTWSKHNNIWSISSKKARQYDFLFRRLK